MKGSLLLNTLIQWNTEISSELPIYFSMLKLTLLYFRVVDLKEISSYKVWIIFVSQFLDLLSFSKIYWYLARNCSLTNLDLSDLSIDHPSKDAPFRYLSYQKNGNCVWDIFSFIYCTKKSRVASNVYVKFETNTPFIPKATHSLAILMIMSATRSLLR